MLKVTLSPSGSTADSGTRISLPMVTTKNRGTSSVNFGGKFSEGKNG